MHGLSSLGWKRQEEASEKPCVQRLADVLQHAGCCEIRLFDSADSQVPMARFELYGSDEMSLEELLRQALDEVSARRRKAA
ncbi:MAG: hypothetical protein ACFB3T_06285 [Geminicoccaceae bacterium]